MGITELFGRKAPRENSDARNALPGEMVTTAACLPGWTVRKHLSIVGSTQISDVGFNQKKGSGQAYEAAMRELCESATALGANAVLNVRLVAAPLQLNGSAWVTSTLILTGDAVRAIKDEE